MVFLNNNNVVIKKNDKIFAISNMKSRQIMLEIICVYFLKSIKLL
jgi:hypothetical protein